MSAREVHDALHGWAARLVPLGAVVVTRLRTGLTWAETDEVAQRHGYDLTEEVAALWTWRDGVGARPGRAPAHLAPGQEFASLDESLRRSREYLEASRAEQRAGTAPVTAWQPHWVVAVHGHATPLVLDGSRPGPDTFRHDPQADALLVAHSTLPQRIARWHDMLDTGTWRVARDGTWDVDLSHLTHEPHTPRTEVT
ncbi:hypothetical protein [Cellulomonas dongxiuzhuiae]|uniref:hypothetical protein n=1 Tax=Cellulomonas dongxiuzhuiae TaxID=2819979 RepID=UPI001AAEA6DF|nr:hypothetical protein [Cellulomonas dongxiuzhuiae]MBO3089838.1 hypothetical protein [Cellulomonas dongxiuzhuiae]